MTNTATLDPSAPEQWTMRPGQEIFNLSSKEAERAQLDALRIRFNELKPQIDALGNLAEGENIDSIEELNDILPLLFDHKVYKSYPLSLLEKRNFKRLTSWLNKLTTNDLSKVSLDGLKTVDDWLARLDESGMIVGHSTGTTGKLSFIPRSQEEFPAWAAAYYAGVTIAMGVDLQKEKFTMISPSYREGHQMMVKMGKLMANVSAGGDDGRDMLYDHAISSDLLSLSGRLQAADAKGELEDLELDPELLEQYKAHIAASKNRETELYNWFKNCAEKYQGDRVVMGGTAAELVRIVLRAKDEGVTCNFADDSILMTGGGFKGFKGAPEDWRGLLIDYFGMSKVCSVYGMSETMATCPQCSEGHYHIPPYLIPFLLDEEGKALPRSGEQIGRFALFDLLAKTYWGGFISGDRVTINWEENCGCGMKSPRIGPEIVRFSELQGVEDDKITCAGTQEAYNNFMDFVTGEEQ